MWISRLRSFAVIEQGYTTPTKLMSMNRASTSMVPVSMEPGDIIDFKTLVRNWHTLPAVGLNSILNLPVWQFERVHPSIDAPTDSDAPETSLGSVIVPNSVFGVPLRKDLAFRVYQYHRRALAGYQETMQFHKWEWVGRNAKHRKRLETGASRMGRRKAPGKYEGVFAHPLRPTDWRQSICRRVVHRALRVMLSAKFAQGQVRVVDSFNIHSHKTKHLVAHVRNLLGPKCNSALFIHEGNRDVNDNFRWASAHLPQIRRENVEGVNVYTLAKYREVVITEKALEKLIRSIEDYPRKRGWLPVNATPNGERAPVPEMVPGWDAEWRDRRRKLQQSEQRGKLFAEERRNWKWNPNLRGPLKIPANDKLAGFRLRDYTLFEATKNDKRFEFNDLFADDDPIEIGDEFELHDQNEEVVDVTTIRDN
jgi:large subunit ribosomal protein L4